MEYQVDKDTTIEIESVSKLPSRYQIDDKVVVSFGLSGRIENCKVIKVHFTKSKVLYDIEIAIECEDLDGKESTSYTRVYNIDSCFVEEMSDFVIETSAEYNAKYITGIPRRNQLDKLVPVETSIFNAIQDVEKLPADERLSKAQILLGEAKDLVSDYIDSTLNQTNL